LLVGLESQASVERGGDEAVEPPRLSFSYDNDSRGGAEGDGAATVVHPRGEGSALTPRVDND
jgi:hypothetical protein